MKEIDIFSVSRPVPGMVNYSHERIIYAEYCSIPGDGK